MPKSTPESTAPTKLGSAARRNTPRRWRTIVLAVVLVLSLLVALTACEGCRPSGNGTTPAAVPETPPTARLYLVSDLAGALEPCGCVKDQLGGMDHFAGLVSAEKKSAAASATLTAGPVFFMDMELAADKKSQEVAKAETIASSLKTLGLLAFTPGRNEWAASSATLTKLAGASGAPLVAANVGGSAGAVASTVKELGGLKIGIIGVAAPDKADKAPATPDAPVSSAPIAAVKNAVTTLKSTGAQAIIVLAAVGRGEAKRIADENPELLAIVVGSPGSSGDLNTKAPPPERIGDVLVVETANHLQTVGVLDLHVRPGEKPGRIAFTDGTGIERMRKREELNGRIDELRAKIATWEKDKSVDARDVSARKADVTKLEAERDALEKSPAPATGSFYRFTTREIRDNVAADDAVKGQMLAFYKQVNDANKVAFKDKVPPPPAKGEPGYVGIDVCTNCHEEPRKVWDKTSHAHAYMTLEKQFKEANLDCVSCHVTGYDKAGGSTVTHVADLKDVQCEVCHGPGQLHAAKPDKVKIPIAKPGPDTCIGCHHPPHVHAFDAPAKMAEILGPGHGRPK